MNALNIEVSETDAAQLEIYFSELKKWSKKVNLIAKSSTDEQILENHFLDSLTLLPLLEGQGKHLLDIGTGAGFPGLVCKVANPELQVSLVEPRLKRVNFLKHVVRTLELDGVSVLENRIEDERALDSDRTISHITSRAVSDIAGFLHMVERFSCTGASIVCMKGPRWKQELEEANTIITQSKFKLSTTESCVLPFSGAERCLLIFEPVTQ